MQTGSRVLVTGGAGYIGSVVCARLLRDGYSVCVLDELNFGGLSLLPLYTYPNFTFHRGDVCDTRSISSLLEEGVDYVVHLAAVVGDPASAQQPHRTQQVNYEATCHLVSLCKQLGVDRFLFVSTCSNYGLSDSDDLAEEHTPLHPLSLYAETKVKSEQYVLELGSDHFKVCVLRLATAFGLSPRMRFDLLVNEFTRDAVLSGKIVAYGEQFWRPYVHTLDIAEAMSLVLKAPSEVVSNQVFNVGSDDLNYQKAHIIQMVLDEVPGTVVERVPQVSDPRNYRVSFAKINRELGFRPERSVENGIQEIASALRQGVITDVYSSVYRNSE